MEEKIKKEGNIIHRFGSYLRAVCVCVLSSRFPGSLDEYCDNYNLENQESPGMCITNYMR